MTATSQAPATEQTKEKGDSPILRAFRDQGGVKSEIVLWKTKSDDAKVDFTGFIQIGDKKTSVIGVIQTVKEGERAGKKFLSIKDPNVKDSNGFYKQLGIANAFNKDETSTGKPNYFDTMALNIDGDSEPFFLRATKAATQEQLDALGFAKPRLARPAKGDDATDDADDASKFGAAGAAAAPAPAPTEAPAAAAQRPRAMMRG